MLLCFPSGSRDAAEDDSQLQDYKLNIFSVEKISFC